MFAGARQGITAMAISGSALKSTIGPDRLDMTSPASRADLAIGMQLLRASNMKAVRLQLALVRRDSGLAIDAIDGLIDLDAEIAGFRSEEHTSELQSLMRISYAVFCLKKKNKIMMKP